MSCPNVSLAIVSVYKGLRVYIIYMALSDAYSNRNLHACGISVNGTAFDFYTCFRNCMHADQYFKTGVWLLSDGARQHLQLFRPATYWFCCCNMVHSLSMRGGRLAAAVVVFVVSLYTQVKSRFTFTECNDAVLGQGSAWSAVAS